MMNTFVVPSGRAGERGAALMEKSGPPLATRAVATLALDASAHVLEIGFGPGIALQMILEQVPNGHVIGIDPSRLMHRRASQRNVSHITSGRLELLHGVAGNLPFPDNTFDRILSIDNAHFWPDLTAGLDEARRVLRPRGILVIAFTPFSGGPPLQLSRALSRSDFISVTEQRTRDGEILHAR